MTMEAVSEIFSSHRSRKYILYSIHTALFHSSNHTAFQNASVASLQTNKNEMIMWCKNCIWSMEMCNSANCLHVPYVTPALRLKLLSLFCFASSCSILAFFQYVWGLAVFGLVDYRHKAANLCPKLFWQDCMKF